MILNHQPEKYSENINQPDIIDVPKIIVRSYYLTTFQIPVAATLMDDF